jgi:hypothetical protein
LAVERHARREDLSHGGDKLVVIEIGYRV